MPLRCGMRLMRVPIITRCLQRALQEEYATMQGFAYALHGIVALNSLINPFLFGRISIVKRRRNVQQAYEFYSSSTSSAWWRALTNYRVQIH